MQALLDAIVDLVALVSPTKVGAVAGALRGISSPADAPGAGSLVGTPAARASVVRLLDAWANTPASGDEVAGMLLGASEARRRVSGPTAIASRNVDSTVRAGLRVEYGSWKTIWTLRRCARRCSPVS